MRRTRFAAVFVALISVLGATAHAQSPQRPTPWWKKQEPPRRTDPNDQRENLESPLPGHARLAYFNELFLDAEPEGGAANLFELRADLPLSSEDIWGVLHGGAVPFLALSEQVAGDSSEIGLGDARYNFLITRRARRGGADTGFGLAVTLPTATDAELGFKRFTVGPQFAAVWTRSVWRFGFSGVQRWSVNGSDKGEKVSQAAIEPFVYLNLESGWYAFSRPTIRADWERDEDRIAAPIGGGMGRVLDMGEGRPLDIQGSVYTSVTDAVGEPQWTIRLQIQSYLGR
ncbi:MAG: hypothetical protein AAFR11_14485 [Pseudomonadota bacterium]